MSSYERLKAQCDAVTKERIQQSVLVLTWSDFCPDFYYLFIFYFLTILLRSKCYGLAVTAAVIGAMVW